MKALTLILAVVAAAPERPAGNFHERFKAREQEARDGGALLELGRWCEAEKQNGWAAQCYKKVLKLGDAGPNRKPYVEASLRLASLEAAGQDLASAYGRLLELRAKYNSEEAQKLLVKLQGEKARQQLTHLEAGEECLQRKEFEKARIQFEKAHDLSPREPTPGYVPRRLILEKLALCRRKLDEAEAQKKTIPVERDVETCTSCSQTGFLTCQKCGGSRFITETGYRFTLRGMQPYTERKPCTTCRGHGFRGCSTCLGLGKLSRDITPNEQKALEALIAKVANPKFLKTPLADTLKAVEEALLEVRSGSSLNYLRAIQPTYGKSTYLRDALRKVPPAAAPPAQASRLWKNLGTNYQVGIDFLLHYACEYARHIARFDMLRRSQAPELDTLPQPPYGEGEVLSPELLAAFPDEKKEAWLRVEGILTNYADEPKENKGRLRIEGQFDHDIAFYVWLPGAQEELQQLGARSWRNRVRELGARYPFDLAGKLSSSPRDHHVLLAGRFLRDRLGRQRNWFEVWGIEIGMSRAQERIYRSLAQPLDISIPERPAGEIAQILQNWFDLRVRFQPGVADSRLVTCNAAACPIGVLVDELATSGLEAEWFYEDGVVFVPKARPADARDIKVVVERLRQGMRGSVTVARAAARGADSPLPADRAGLRVRARQAAQAMDYAAAARCFEELLLNASPRQHRQLTLLRLKYDLFDQLTRNTPVSRLIAAPEVTEIVYQKESGGTIPPTPVVVLERGSTHWSIQEAYGVSFKIRGDLVREAKPIPAATWRARKEAELRSREAELAAASGRDRAYKSLLLALFAKTNNFLERGSDHLEAAVAGEEFAWVLATFFPGQAEELGRAWRVATRRQPADDAPRLASAEPGRPRPPPVVAAELEASLSLPDGPDDLLAFAAREASKGSRNLGQALQGEDADKWRRQAFQCFKIAESAAARFLEGRPEHAEARKLRQELQHLIQIAQKDLGFFGA